MDLVNLIVQLGSGAAAGNFTGSMSDKFNLGVLGNSITGMIGGGLGMNVVNSALGLATASAAASDPDIGALAAQIAGSGIGGSIMTLLLGIAAQPGRSR